MSWLSKMMSGNKMEQASAVWKDKINPSGAWHPNVVEETRSTTSTWCTQGSADDCSGSPATYSSGYRRVIKGFRPPSAWSLPGSCANQRVRQPDFKTVIKTWCRSRRSQDCPWRLLLDIRGCPYCHSSGNPERRWESSRRTKSKFSNQRPNRNCGSEKQRTEYIGTKSLDTFTWM